LLNNLASSIVLEARRNPKGLGSVEEKLLLAGHYRILEIDAISRDDRDVLVDSAVALFLDHNLCFRQTDPLSSRVYLVFPDLINLRKPVTLEDDEVEEGVAYTVAGQIENLYASLVVLLGYASTFTRTNQWRNHARYIVGDGLVCGFRLEAQRDAELDFVLYFGATVGAPIRTLFQGLFESFLTRRNLTIRRYEPVNCPNGHELNRAVVREQLAKASPRAFCPQCGRAAVLPQADEPIALSREDASKVQGARREVAERARFEHAIFRLNAYATQEDLVAPSCFISYAWGRPDQERWVEAFATDLVKTGVPVVLDRWENARVGISVARFVERLADADRVIVVGTPLYRAKYDNGDPMRGFVAAAEGDLIGVRMLDTEELKSTVLPVLLEGTSRQALPPLLQGRAHGDFRDPATYAAQFLRLAVTLYDIPAKHPIVDEVERLLRASDAQSE
jgi:hypothetical protein